MLKGIPNVISPELMKILLEMGHGDELIIADGNFPAASCAQRLVRSDGNGTKELLDGILKFFPIDTFSDDPVALMEVVEGDSTVPTIWGEYQSIIQKYEPQFEHFKFIERFAFYERAKKAYAIVATSEGALYANIVLKKGVVTDS
ncbi:RbsD/FucU family protein [Salirhabdus salicampi]|uniref:RbsD/FucU family protein n=1 Tax=Salirhabdus salicampi TaxID=476102 RepID=UPI0020C4941A|nr:RbsD/FucU domain-containing protein [Salirhabdus salicampi]MCP8617567.1 fucose isomerase [Salirhabdus salicampi]